MTMMKSIALLAVAIAVSIPQVAGAQPRERVSGNDRICVYPGLISSSDRIVTVPYTQNCPPIYQGDLSRAYAMPPTAYLDEERIERDTRRCAYVQAGTIWWRVIPVAQR